MPMLIVLALARICVLDDAVGVNDVLRRATANVDHQRPKFLVFVAQGGQRGGDAVEHDGSRFTVERVASRRITQVKMERLPNSAKIEG